MKISGDSSVTHVQRSSTKSICSKLMLQDTREPIYSTAQLVEKDFTGKRYFKNTSAYMVLMKTNIDFLVNIAGDHSPKRTILQLT